MFRTRQSKSIKQRREIFTKLTVNDGHVWDSLVAVIITFSIEFFGAHVYSWTLNSCLSTHF